MATGSKEEAQAAYDAALERFEAARDDLAARREELDGYLREEEARRAAVFMGFEEGDEAGVRAALHLSERRREAKRRAHADAEEAGGDFDGPVGGVR